MEATVDTEVVQFIQWCNNQEQPPLSQLRRKDDEEPHNYDTENEISKWALYANKIRMQYHICSLQDEICKAINDDENIQKWWDWDAYTCNCFCEGCDAKKPNYYARYLYTEKLVRKQKWYEKNEEDALLETAKSYWTRFFGPLQMYCLENNKLDKKLTFVDFQEQMKNYGVNFKELVDNNFCNIDISTSTGPVVAMQKIYKISSLLNYYRSIQNTPDQLDDVITPEAFNTSIYANFQGFAEDNYCLGCLGNVLDRSTKICGTKFYIGITNNKKRRHKEHLHLPGSYPGSKWIKKLCHNNEENQPDPFGGWKIMGDEEAYRVLSGCYSGLDEDTRTVMFVIQYGMKHVRGGIYCTSNTEFSDIDRRQLTKKKRAALKLCYKCGSPEHPAQNCINPDLNDDLNENTNAGRRRTLFQPLNEDEALNMHNEGAKHWTDKDERTWQPNNTHFDLCQRFGNAIITNDKKPTKCVLWTSGGDTFSDIENPNVLEIVNKIFPNYNGKMRKGQVDAIHAFLDGKQDIVLAVPTAYGKTAAYMTAAIKQVLDGGKVVIHLPYTALMSDIATTFAELSQPDKNLNGLVVGPARVVKVDLDERVEGVWMVYGGSFYVPTNEENSLREIKWTIWRGKGNDDYMREHEKSDIFRNADIVLATPDKWAYPNSIKSNCDSYITTFKSFTKGDVLLIIDEAHQFQDILGGSECEVIRRMGKLLICQNSESKLRILLASATLGSSEEDAKEFAKELIGRPEDTLTIIQPNTPQHFEVQDVLDEDGNDDKLEIDDVVEQAKAKPNELHRFLFIYKEKLEIDFVCNKILTNHLYHPSCRNLRRVIIFLDSKSQATKYIRYLNNLKRENAWPDNYKIYVTPYHGDCASMHRRMYEKMMNKYVKENELHIIVTTSALEAGVNVRGADILIIPDATTCGRASLTQRIGRGGRKPGHPALIFIGVNKNECDTSQLIEDPKTYFREGGGKPGITSTNAVVLNGCLQFLRNVRQVENLSWQTGGQSSKVKDAAYELVRNIIDADNDYRHLCQKHSLPDAENYVKLLYEEEVPTKKAISVRGIESNSVKVLHCDDHGCSLRPWDNSADADRVIPRYDVVLSKLDSMTALRYLHPEAHYRTPHGKLVRVLRYKYEPSNQLNASGGDWLKTMTKVKCTPTTRVDENFRWSTRGEYTESVKSNEEGLNKELKAHIMFGTLERTIQWKGFKYYTGYSSAPIGEEVTVEDLTKPKTHGGYGYPENFFFFQPAVFHVSGWEWCIDISGWSDELQQILKCQDEDEDATINSSQSLLIVQSELRLRAAKCMYCSPQQFVIELNIPDNDIDRANLIFRCYEISSSGIARHIFRTHMSKVLEDHDVLFLCRDDEEYKEMTRKLYNYALEGIVKNISDDTVGIIKRILKEIRTAWGNIV
eukprot:g4519.t1